MSVGLWFRSLSLLGGRHKEGRSRGTGHDPTFLKHRKEKGRIVVDVVLNIGKLEASGCTGVVLNLGISKPLVVLNPGI